jgi:site-specific recombinase XerD
MPRLAAPIKTDPTLLDAKDAWRASMFSAGRPPKTVRTYLYALDQLCQYLGYDYRLAAVTRRDLEGLQGSLLARMKPSSVLVVFGALHSFWVWAVGHQDMPITKSPMEGMSRPRVPTMAVEFVTDVELRAILATCKSQSSRNYLGRRDEALLRLLATAGGRLAEVGGLRVEDVDLLGSACRVMGKGSRERWLPLDEDTTNALRRYIERERPRHASAATSPWLWLSRGNRMTDSGIAQMVAERGKMALGPDHRRVHPHELRHRAIATMLAGGMSEGDVMSISGHRDRGMLDRYGAFTRARRAHDAFRRAASRGELPKL